MSTIARRQTYWGPAARHLGVSELTGAVDIARWTRAAIAPIGLGLLVPLLLLELQSAWTTVAGPWFASYAFADLGGYLEGARRLLATGSPYLPSQLTGAWQLEAHSFIHPPTALPLFLVFLVLPAPLWWAVPLSVTGYVLWKLRPSGWTWALIALAVFWPRSVGSLLAGNSDMWAMALAAVAVRWGPGPVLLMVKPTFAPLALIGLPRRSWWVAVTLSCGAVLVSLPLWVQYAAVVGGANLPLTYSLWNLPLVAVPVLGWMGSRASE